MSMLPSRNKPTGRVATRRSIRNHCLAIGGAAVVLVLGFGTLGATTKLAGAVMATGTLVVKSNVKKISHQTGGIVGAINVEEGTHVAAGEVLVHLDETVAEATFAGLTHDLYEQEAQRARLEAERDGDDAIAFPKDLTAVTDPDVAHILTSETKLLELRRKARTGQKDQLSQRIVQLRNEILGLQQQSVAKDTESTIVGKELVGVRDLYARNLVQLTRLDGLERDAARIAGERGALTAQVAQVKGKIAETELQIIQIDEDMRSDVGRQLADLRAKTSDTVERRVAALDQLQHLDIRAPQAGTVHEISVHAKGAVITPGEQIMLIVPDSDRLVAEVRVAPQDIDQVAPEQKAILRFLSFNQRTTPEVVAHVTLVAADTTEDQRNGTSYYVVQIELPSDHPVKGARLRPGMPVDAFIQTSERTMLSYLMKPLVDQMGRSFREK